MKTITTIFSVVIITCFCKAQLLPKVLTAFKSPSNFVFNSKGIEQKIKIKDGYFDEVRLVFDETGELNNIVFSATSNKKLNKHKGDILETLTTLFGPENNSKTVTYGTDYLFLKDSLSAKFEFNDVYTLLRLYPTNNIKTIEKYDEFNKSTSIRAINFYPYVEKNGATYEISFTGYKETKLIFMRLVVTSPDWSFIKKLRILLKDGEVIDKEIESSRSVIESFGSVKTKEVGIADLDNQQIELVLTSSPVKIRIEGKGLADFTLPEEIIDALRAVYKKVNT